MDAWKFEPQLTPREQDVLQLYATGLSVREIGERLSLSPTTIGTHLERLRLKLGPNRSAVVAAAKLRGLLPGTGGMATIRSIYSAFVTFSLTRLGALTAEEGAVTVLEIAAVVDRKSTRLNSSHANISYAVFCL